MSSELHQILPIDADETVSEAVDLAVRFATAKKDEKDYAGKPEIIRDIAKEAKLRASFVQRLVEPARRPKRVDAHVRNRLFTAYTNYLRRKLIAIETEVARLEAMARPDHRAVENLAARARAVTRQIESLL